MNNKQFGKFLRNGSNEALQFYREQLMDELDLYADEAFDTNPVAKRIVMEIAEVEIALAERGDAQ